MNGSVNAVPEPTNFAIVLGVGLVVFSAARRRRTL